MQYDTEWRACRRLEHIALNATAVKDYQPMQERVAAEFIHDLAADPENFYDIVRLCVSSLSSHVDCLNRIPCRCAARIVLSVTYGLSAKIVDTEVSTTR